MEQRGLSRRKFLQMMAGSAAAAIAASVAPLSVVAQDMMYSEAPMLADLVANGSLPPVEERLPINPRVVTPPNEVGQYGGTLRRAFKGISDRWGPTKLNEEMAIEWIFLIPTRLIWLRTTFQVGSKMMMRLNLPLLYVKV